MLSHKIPNILKNPLKKCLQLPIRSLSTPLSNAEPSIKPEPSIEPEPSTGNLEPSNKPEPSNKLQSRSEKPQAVDKYNLRGRVSEPLRQMVRQWRAELNDPNTDYIPSLHPDLLLFRIFRTECEMTPWGINKFIKAGIRKRLRATQEFSQLRYDMLGPDILAAHFLIFENGRIKYKGDDKWISLKEVRNKEYMMPDAFDPRYVLVEIDASGCDLFFEALENFKDIPRMRWASFARVPQLNDWWVDKISNLFPNLEFLDLSGCPGLTERGLEALYRVSKLRSLVVTNHRKTATFEYTCLLLEDAVPGLKVTILEPEDVTLTGKETKGEMKALEAAKAK